jgi:hypothetical protein
VPLPPPWFYRFLEGSVDWILLVTVLVCLVGLIASIAGAASLPEGPRVAVIILALVWAAVTFLAVLFGLALVLVVVDIGQHLRALVDLQRRRDKDQPG